MILKHKSCLFYIVNLRLIRFRNLRKQFVLVILNRYNCCYLKRNRRKGFRVFYFEPKYVPKWMVTRLFRNDKHFQVLKHFVFVASSTSSTGGPLLYSSLCNYNKDTWWIKILRFSESH